MKLLTENANAKIAESDLETFKTKAMKAGQFLRNKVNQRKDRYNLKLIALAD